MESFYLLIPIALVFVAVAIRILFWAINSGQYDNLDTEAHRILFDDDIKTDKPLDASPEQSADNKTENHTDDNTPINPQNNLQHKPEIKDRD